MGEGRSGWRRGRRDVRQGRPDRRIGRGVRRWRRGRRRRRGDAGKSRSSRRRGRRPVRQGGAIGLRAGSGVRQGRSIRRRSGGGVRQGCSIQRRGRRILLRRLRNWRRRRIGAGLAAGLGLRPVVMRIVIGIRAGLLGLHHGGRMEQALTHGGQRKQQRRGDQRQGQQAGVRRRRRRALDQIRMGRQQIAHGRRRAPVRIVEHHIGTPEINLFLLDRRRHVEFVNLETRRRGQRGVDRGEAQARVAGMRSARIALQIGPIGARRIGQPGAPPGHRLAAHGEHGAHPRGIGGIGIGVEEIDVGGECVLLQRRGISLIDRIVANGPRAHIGLGLDRHRWRRRARRAGE